MFNHASKTILSIPGTKNVVLISQPSLCACVKILGGTVAWWLACLFHAFTLHSQIIHILPVLWGFPLSTLFFSPVQKRVDFFFKCIIFYSSQAKKNPKMAAVIQHHGAERFKGRA